MTASAQDNLPYAVATDIHHANVCDVEIRNTQPLPTVAFAADPCGGPEALWFCFRLLRRGQTASHVELVLKHVENMLGLSLAAAPAMRLVVRYEGGAWQRTEVGAARMLHDGRGTIAWMIDAPPTYVDVAFCYPYGGDELIHLVEEATSGYWRPDVIGVSQGGRGIVRLSNDGGCEDGTRPGVYIIARQHSGETPGSWVLDGLLRRIAAMGTSAPLVWAVPFANADGVTLGHYGKDNFPYDLNRAWSPYTPMRHETLVLQRDLWRWRKRCRPVLALDLHAPGGAETDGVYAFLKTAPKAEIDAGVREWAARLASGLGACASADFAKVATYASRWETPTFTEFCCTHMEVCAMSLETSYQAAGGTVLTLERYQEIGARIADAIAGT